MDTNKLLEKLVPKRELAHCLKDPIYFIDNYGVVQHPVHGVHPFVLYDYQETLVSSYSKHNTICASSRQAGTSVTTMMYLLWEGFFKPERTIMLVSNKMDAARDNLQKIKFAYEALPDWMKESNPIRESYKQELILSNGTRFQANAASAYIGRGMALSIIHFDNFGHIRESLQEEMMMCLMPCIHTGGRMFITSSGLGAGLFKKIYEDALKGENNFNPIKITWQDVPSLSKDYKKEMIEMIGEDAWEAEYECEFIKTPWWQR